MHTNYYLEWVDESRAMALCQMRSAWNYGRCQHVNRFYCGMYVAEARITCAVCRVGWSVELCSYMYGTSTVLLNEFRRSSL